MKRSSVIFLQIIIVVLAIGALAFMLWEPHLEGRNAHSTLFQIYFNDPFLAYAYIASIPFFVALFKAFKIFGYAGQNKIYSKEAVKALQTIKLCAMVIIGFVVVGEAFILLDNNDDHTGSVFMGLLITVSSIAMATAAAISERNFKNTVDKKSKNNLTA